MTITKKKVKLSLWLVVQQKTDLEQEKLDELLKRLLQDLSVKAASQLAADLTGIKKKSLINVRLS